jgi:hypothetical protein
MRASHRKQFWTPADIQHLRWYADRGLSQAETAALMRRTEASIAIKAGYLGIRFHGPDGAPFGNRNGVKPTSAPASRPR